jgi:hypothetical protein
MKILIGLSILILTASAFAQPAKCRKEAKVKDKAYATWDKCLSKISMDKCGVEPAQCEGPLKNFVEAAKKFVACGPSAKVVRGEGFGSGCAGCAAETAAILNKRDTVKICAVQWKSITGKKEMPDNDCQQKRRDYAQAVMDHCALKTKSANP